MSEFQIEDYEKFIDDIIKSLYLSVLGRPADVSGLAQYRRLFGDRDFPKAIERSVSGMLKSYEFERKVLNEMADRVEGKINHLEAEKIEIQMIVYNEEEMLKRSIKPLLEHFNKFTFLDMESTDQTRAVISDILGERARIISFPRTALLKNGFAYTRNFLSLHSSNEWILAVDADEILISGINGGKITFESALEPKFAAKIKRHNLTSKTWKSGDPLDGASFEIGSVEHRTRLYRYNGETRWAGYLHEELERRSSTLKTVNSSLVFDHLSRFSGTSNSGKKRFLYSWMLLQIYENPALRQGVNRYWYDQYIPKHLIEIKAEARKFSENL